MKRSEWNAEADHRAKMAAAHAETSAAAESLHMDIDQIRSEYVASVGLVAYWTRKHLDGYTNPIIDALRVESEMAALPVDEIYRAHVEGKHEEFLRLCADHEKKIALCLAALYTVIERIRE